MEGNTDGALNATKPVERNSHIAVDGTHNIQRIYHAVFLQNASFHY